MISSLTTTPQTGRHSNYSRTTYSAFTCTLRGAESFGMPYAWLHTCEVKSPYAWHAFSLGLYHKPLRSTMKLCTRGIASIFTAKLVQKRRNKRKQNILNNAQLVNNSHAVEQILRKPQCSFYCLYPTPSCPFLHNILFLLPSSFFFLPHSNTTTTLFEYTKSSPTCSSWHHLSSV